MASFDDVLPVATIKKELGLPSNDDSQDDLFIRHAKAGFDLVSSQTGRSLLNEEIRVQVNAPDSLQGHIAANIVLPAAATAIAANWIDAAGTETEIADPSKIIIGGRHVDRYGYGQYAIAYNAPNGLWPGWKAGNSRIELSLQVGMKEIPPALAQAAMLAIRSFYTGIDLPAQFEALVAPFRVSGMEKPESGGNALRESTAE